MNEVVKFLSNKVFYIATVDGDQPHVRPFGVIVEFEGKAYINCHNEKNVFKQILANPKVEICALGSSTREWMRVTCTLARDTRREARLAVMEAAPGLKSMYSIDDGRFEVFYIDSGKATRYSNYSTPVEEYVL